MNIFHNMATLLLYEALWDLQVWYSLCTHSLWQLYGVRLRGAVQIRTAGVRKCHLLQIVLHGMVNWRERSQSCTPAVQGATGPPSLIQFVYTQPK